MTSCHCSTFMRIINVSRVIPAQVVCQPDKSHQHCPEALNRGRRESQLSMQQHIALAQSLISLESRLQHGLLVAYAWHDSTI